MGDNSQTNLIINYLPQTLTDDEFKSMFQSIGTLNSCKIIRDRATNYSFGYGFVDYASPEHAANAIETLNGLQLQNKRIKVAYSRNHDKVKGANLYMKNVPRDYTQDQLEAMCADYGKIVNVRILTDQMTGKSKGIGFVLFDTREEAEKAQLSLDGYIPEGATDALNVKFADDNISKVRAPPVMVVNQYRPPTGWGGGYQGGGGLGGGYGAAHQTSYGGPTRNQGRYNQRYNPFGNAQSGPPGIGSMGGGGGGGAGGANGDSAEGHILFVYNIGPDADERALWQLFAPFGNIAKVNVIRDLQKGTGKGYGFVTMPNMYEAQSAIQSLNGYRYYGKPLQVSFKTQKA